MRGSGKSYEHENNYIANQPTSKVSTGWFSYEHGTTTLEDFKILPIMSTLFNIRQENSNC